VQSNKTGTYIVELFDSDNSRHISRSYTIDSSGTWEQKTITFPGDTTGSLDNDNGNSLTVRWWLAVGTDWSSGTLATSWQAQDNTDRAVGQVNLADSTNNEWQITGVQLEAGSVATPFEHRSYGDELQRCQRYYQISTRIIGTWTGSSRFRVLEHFGTPMRAAPTTTLLDTAIYHEYWAQVGYSTLSTIHSATSRIESADVSVDSASASGRSMNQFAMLENGAFGFSAEL